MATETPRQLADRVAKAIHLVRSSPFIPVEPTDLQWAVLSSDTPELLMGGGAGSGKSVALLAAALMYVHVPGYSALMVRKTFPDLAQPGGLMHIANDWLYNTDARKHDGGKRWSFPSGAELSFGHMENEQEKARYQGSEHQYVAFDEVTHIEESAYVYLQSRVRRSLSRHPDLADIPLRMRCGANPGGRHSGWVKRRFISDDDGIPVVADDRVYIHSTLTDNPHLDQVAYAKNLSQLGPVERAQLQHGDWTVTAAGHMFAADSFVLVDGKVTGPAHRVRSWDLAGSGSKTADYCAGTLWARDKNTGVYRIEHVVHGKFEPGPLEKLMRQTAELDGRDVQILIEEERAGSGKLVLSHMRRDVLKGFRVRGVKPVGDKAERASLLSALVDRGEVEVTKAPWNEKLIAEFVSFPGAKHDDLVDSSSQAVHYLARLPVRNKPAPDSEAPAVEEGGEGLAKSPPGGTRGGTPEQKPFFLPGIPGRSNGIRRDPWKADNVRNRIEGGNRWR